jgi:predicted ATPase
LLNPDLSLALITPHYLAPEQVLGQPLDARTDLYALGAMLYELFTGRPLFSGSDQEILEHHRLTTPIPPREVNPRLSRSLEHVILKLLDKDPNQRYPFVSQVRRILTGLAMTASRSGQSQTVSRPRWPALVGRDEPLQRLLALWEETRQGQGQLVLIQSEIGLGKTRLVQEFADQVGEATVLIGHCQQSEGSVAYQPFIDALKAYFAATAAEVAAAQMGPVLNEAVQFVPEIQYILPNVSAPVQESPAGLNPFSLAQAINKVAAKRPWLLILDDLDWADSCSLQLLDYLARHCGQMALMIVVTCDKDVSDNKPLTETLNHLNGHLAYTSITLRHLGEAEVKRLLENIWGQPVPPAVVSAIYRRTQGNPLFVEEVAKSLSDEGVVSWKQGQWHFGSLTEANLPQRPREAILRRIRCLSKETQSLLQQAAVIGYTFSFDDLHTVSDLSQWDALENLDATLERQLIKDLSSEGNYCFNHLRTQQVLYENLSPLKQRLIHREIGETLEQRHLPDSERTAALLAYHFFQAKELEHGLPYSIQAAAQASVLYASHNALVWYTLALDTLDQLEQTEARNLQRFELLLAREQIYDNLGERVAQRGDLAALQSLAQTLNDPAKQAIVHNRQARYERAMSQFNQAITEAQAGLIAARRANQVTLQGESLFHLAHISASQGHMEMASAHMHDAQEILGGNGNPQVKAKTLNGLGDMYKLLQDYPQAESYYQQALELNRSVGNRYGEAACLSSLGNLCLERKEYAGALSYCQQAVQINRLIGHRRGEAVCLHSLSLAYQGLGNHQAAQRCMTESLAIRHSFDEVSDELVGNLEQHEHKLDAPSPEGNESFSIRS